MTLDIVEGDISQLRKIVDLNSQIFQGMYEREPFSFEEYLEKLRDKFPIIYLAKEDEDIVGNSMAFSRENSFYIWVLGIDKNHRNKGLATKLLDLNEQLAKSHGFRSVSLKVYNTSPEMQRLLIKRGYQIQEVNRSERDPKYNAVCFVLNL